MEQTLKLKSNFNAFKLISIWFIIILVAIFPYLVSLFQPHREMAVFTILTGSLAFAVTLYLKIDLRVIIHPQKHVIEYYWMNLFGKEHQTIININNAYFNLNLVRYRGNDLCELTVNDNANPSKKIRLTEQTFGFNEQQIKSMHELVLRLSIDHVDKID